MRRSLHRGRVLPSVALLLTAALTLDACVTPTSKWVSPTSGQAGETTPSASGGPSSSTFTAPVDWKPCPGIANEVLGHPVSNVTYDCGSVRVPQDWANRQSGATFDISVVRGRAAGQRDRIGSLLINPGGPGVSGVDHAVYGAATLPVEITRRFDIVGFDPRGVERSAPVKCFADTDLDANFGTDPDPVGQVEFEAAVAIARRLAQSCSQKYGDTLSLLSTEQTAHDMDTVRAAVGDAKTTYLGYSYGTLLGAVYAQLYPRNVRALVLDGAVDPTQKSIESSEVQAKGFERAFDHFSTWCRNTPDQCPIGPDARDAVVQALNNARTSPVRGDDGRLATAGWIFTAVMASLFQESDWRQLALAISTLRQDQASGVFGLADAYVGRAPSGRYSNFFDANAAVNCADNDQTPVIERIRTMQADWRAKYPMFGAAMALNLICAQWPAKRDPYPTGAATGAPPIVVVGTTGDPATPYEQTAALAKMLGVGVTVTWQGEGHTAYPKTNCITQAVDRYLIDLRVPADGFTCPR